MASVYEVEEVAWFTHKTEKGKMVDVPADVVDFAEIMADMTNDVANILTSPRIDVFHFEVSEGRMASTPTTLGQSPPGRNATREGNEESGTGVFWTPITLQNEPATPVTDRRVNFDEVERTEHTVTRINGTSDLRRERVLLAKANKQAVVAKYARKLNKTIRRMAKNLDVNEEDFFYLVHDDFIVNQP